MRMYAYIPIENVSQLQGSYAVNPLTWTFTKDGSEYGGLENPFFTSEQQTEIEALGGEWFESAAAFQDWLTQDEFLLKVKKDKAFGNKVIERFLSENKQVGLTDADNINQMQGFQNIMLFLLNGTIKTAKTILLQVPDYAFVVTPGYNTAAERKQSYVDELTNYLES